MLRQISEGGSWSCTVCFYGVRGRDVGQLANPRGIRIVQNEFIGVTEMIRYSDPTHTRPAVSATGNSSR